MPGIMLTSDQMLLGGAQFQIRFILLQNRQGKTRLAKYYVPLEDSEKHKLEDEVFAFDLILRFLTKSKNLRVSIVVYACVRYRSPRKYEQISCDYFPLWYRTTSMWHRPHSFVLLYSYL